MRKLVVIVLCVLAQIVNAQDLSPLDFVLINNDIKQTVVFGINESEDFKILVQKFNLSEKDSVQIDKISSNKSIEFTKKLNSKSNILPFYFLTDDPAELHLTLFALTVQNQWPNENFHRGDYHFILTTTVNIEDGQPYFKNSNLITDSDAINQWFLDGYETYLDRTKPVFDKYHFTPPPPPLPPTELK